MILQQGNIGRSVCVSRQLDRPVPATVTAEIDISRMPKAEKESAEQEAKVRRLYCTHVYVQGSYSIHTELAGPLSFKCLSP